MMKKIFRTIFYPFYWMKEVKDELKISNTLQIDILLNIIDSSTHLSDDERKKRLENTLLILERIMTKEKFEELKLKHSYGKFFMIY